MTIANQYYTQDMSGQRQIPGMSYIRLFHAAPGAPEVDIYANGRQIGRRLTFGQFTDYISVAAGTYSIEAYPVGMHTNPILNVSIPIENEKVYTLSLIGLLPMVGILPVEDTYEPVNPSRTNIRFANLSPNAPGLTLALRNGPDLFTDIGYTEVSDYKPMSPGAYHMVVKPAGSNIIAVALPNVRLVPGRNLTFYLVGMYAQEPSTLEVYIPMDGTTYLRYY